MKIPFAPPAGYVSDETTFSTAQWVDGNNVRFRMGRAETIGGWSSTMASTLTGVCRNVLPWADNDAGINIAFGTHSALMVYVGGALHDITPAALAAGSIDGAGGGGYGTGTFGTGTYGTSSASEYYARTWSLATYGQTLIANPRGGKIYIWENNTATPATEIVNAPDDVNTILVTPDTRQLMAFGCNVEATGVFDPMCIRWTDLENIDDWTPSSADNAGEQILESGGRIVGAKEMGPYLLVWTDTSLYVAQFIGDPSQTFRFDLVSSNCGLLGPNAATVVDQIAYWITPDLIPYRFQVGAGPQPIPCPIRDDFADNMVTTQAEKLVAFPMAKFGEVWFLYPDERDGIENSRYIAFNTVEGTWFKGRIARTAAADAGPTQYPVMVTSAGEVFWHENGQSANGSALEWSVTSGDQYLDNAQQWVMVRGVWPDFEAQVGAVNLTLTLRKYPQATTTYTKGPYALSANQSKRDFMAQGRIVSLTFSGSSAPAFVRFGKPIFDAVATGQQ